MLELFKGATDINFLTIGLSTKENSHIKAFSDKERINFLALPAFLKEKVPATPGSIIIIKIKNKKNFKQFQQLYANYSDNYYICLLSNYKRKLLFHILSRYAVYMLFIPFIAEEFAKILQAIFKKEEAQSAVIDFYHGLQYLKNTFSWKTAEINISNTTRLLSSLLYHVNLCRNKAEEANIRLGIEEILANAVEHGNLELNSRELFPGSNKEQFYDELKNLRINDPLYNQRLIRVELELNADYLFISIEDEGPGFDTAKAKAIIAGKTGISDHEITQTSGKGYFLVRRIFDIIEFEKGGRKIILGKKVITNNNGLVKK